MRPVRSMCYQTLCCNEKLRHFSTHPVIKAYWIFEANECDDLIELAQQTICECKQKLDKLRKPDVKDEKVDTQEMIPQKYIMMLYWAQFL